MFGLIMDLSRCHTLRADQKRKPLSNRATALPTPIMGFRQTRIRAYLGAWILRLGEYISAAFTGG
jgi:hypothetical protein